VFRASQSTFIGAFAQNIGHATSLEAEFSVCMFALEKAIDMYLEDICIETDFLGVVKAFQKNEGVQWIMQARWRNFIQLYSQIRCTCTHVLRERNMVADALAKNLALYSSQWWEDPRLLLNIIEQQILHRQHNVNC
jgi:ribonuclease HI